MEILGQIFWYAIPLTPLITVPIAWQFRRCTQILRIIIGLGLAGLISLMLYFVSLAVCFSEGMGP